MTLFEQIIIFAYKKVKMATFITAIYIIVPVLIAIAYQHSAFVRRVGTVIIAYAVGLVLALTGMVKIGNVPMLESAQNIIMDISVPIAIPLMLFSCNFKLWTRSLPKPCWLWLADWCR